ncbi:SSI family serine proteinase inhibitor [Streptomyces sp. RKAG337]|uniref:SSI family serine proteinase inhibitor n=1 Tax=Streptomyces sp. RKAG337 TaxID=2893404 RepID=UPI0020335444|nr:SSI family serine proteinase inhibitor [Streptomyces sp. RKAG337]MCM2428698.1 subtilase-type protease inhibitor [Streptomyces sp. RKAG337]
MFVRSLRASALGALALAAIAPVASAAPSGPTDTVRGDHLRVSVSSSGRALNDGVVDLYCHPASGVRADAQSACDALDRLSEPGKELFAPVAGEVLCTLQYGGPATARVTGTWQGRAVDAEFSRANGCEIARWDTFTPLLPAMTSQSLDVVKR